MDSGCAGASNANVRTLPKARSTSEDLAKTQPENRFRSAQSLLEEERLIRNDVINFDPDPLTGDELDKLKRAVNFMQSIRELLQ
jgi:hypothetical protein